MNIRYLDPWGVLLGEDWVEGSGVSPRPIVM